MVSETFALAHDLTADWSLGADWSGGVVPGAGDLAVIGGVSVWVDPRTALAAQIALAGGATLEGNGGGFSFNLSADLSASGLDALYGDGAIVNDGTISVVDGTLHVVVEAGANIAAAYGLAEPSFENRGQIGVSQGGLAIEGTEFSNTGTVVVGEGGVLSVLGGWVDGGQSGAPPGGEILLAGGAALFGDGVTDQLLAFEGPGIVAFADPGDVAAVEVSGFGAADAILAPSVAQARTLLAEGLTFASPLPAGETLTVRPVAAGAEIILQDNEAPPPCFARGTRILTALGYTPVEQLQAGDLVINVAGAALPVRWVGRRTIDLAAHRRPEWVRPVIISAGAIADMVPAREVRLSPDHALWLRGQLVPVKFLVNNATIRRDTACLAVTYFHLELDRHEVVLAENLPAETFIDTGNRDLFENAAGRPRRAPAFGRGKQHDARAFAPLCTSGPILRMIRQELFDRLAALGYRHQTLPDVSLQVGGHMVGRSFGVAWLPCFRLPAGHDGQIIIRSATFVPAEMAVGPGEQEDWRRLGAGIRRIRADGQVYAPELLARGGFHPRAAGDLADWTDGQAKIAVPPATSILGLNISALPKGWMLL